MVDYKPLKLRRSERAIAIAEKYPNVFGHNDSNDAFVLTNDFHSAGRISGAKRIRIRN